LTTFEGGATGRDWQLAKGQSPILGQPGGLTTTTPSGNRYPQKWII